MKKRFAVLLLLFSGFCAMAWAHTSSTLAAAHIANPTALPVGFTRTAGRSPILSIRLLPPKNLQISGFGIPSTFFGMHLIDYTNYPNVSVGALGKGTGVSWPDIEQTQGVFNWSRLDAFVNTAQNNGVDFFYSNDGVPPWAAADRTTCTYTLAYGAGTGCLGMISNISYWDDFVTALVTRYKGKIKIYELWNEPSNPDESVISTADMVTLTTHEYNIIRSIDPAATIVNPSYTTSTSLDAYFAAGGVKTIDVMSLHASPDARGDAELLTRSWVSSVRQVMAKYGLSSKPLWNTEGGWQSAVTDPDLRAAFVARYLLLGWSRGLSRIYWYAWDNSQFGTLFTRGQPESKAAIAYQQVYNWMLGATMPSQCTSSGGYESNGDYIYTPSLYTCVLTRSGGYSAQVVWQTSSDSTLTTVYTVPSQYTQYRDLNGNTFPVPSNRLLTVTNKPIALEGTINTTPTATLAASPTSITAGQSSTLTWSSTNATVCSGTGTFSTGAGPPLGQTLGSTSVSPRSTTTYTVSCTGANGTGTASATVTVK